MLKNFIDGVIIIIFSNAVLLVQKLRATMEMILRRKKIKSFLKPFRTARIETTVINIIL